MPTQQPAVSADGGWLTGLCSLPMTLILASARAAGRATRIGQDGASAMARGVSQAAIWSKERVVPSSRPRADRRSRPAAPPPEAPEPPQVVRPSVIIKSPVRRAVPETVPSEMAGKSAPLKSDPALRIVGTAPRVVAPARAQSAPAGETAFPEVTSADLSVAVFGGAMEKAVFMQTLAGFNNPNEAARARVTAVLAGIPHDLSIKALAARLVRDPSARVRKECVAALGRIGRSLGLPAVEQALADGSGVVRLAAVHVLYRLAGRGCAPLLLRMLSDQDEAVRRRAAVCIGWSGHGALTAELVPLLHNENAWVRLAALEAIENLNSADAIEQVIALLDDTDEAVRKKAFETLKTLTGQELGEAFPRDESERQRAIARWRARQSSAGVGRAS